MCDKVADKILVSIIIPVYNEERYIERCLNSLIKNSYPKDKIEILIFDGGSDDRTIEILKEYKNKYPFIKVFNNPRKFQVHALNMGIDIAKGEIIVRCDAHSEYPTNYIEELVKWHNKNVADNIGGVWKVVPGNDTLKAKAIAIVLNSRFGVGLSYRTLGDKNKPLFVDTVPFGSWKKEVFQKYGKFDEDFIRAQDFEHNVRIRKRGGKILLLPWLEVKYYGRNSLKKLAKMSFQYGYAKPMVYRKHKLWGNKRQFLPVIFVLSLPLSIWLYIPLYLIISLWLFLKNKNKDLLLLPYVFSSFFIIHFFYGLGFIKSFIDNIILKRDIKKLKSVFNKGSR